DQVEGGAILIGDAATEVIDHAAVGDGQSGDGHGHVALDVEDAAGVVAADRQAPGALPFDVQALVENQLAAGQRDGPAGELAGEMDGVAAVGGGDRRPQRAGPAVEGV